MTLYFKKPTEPPPDPEEILWGTCDVCRTLVEVKREQSLLPSKRDVSFGAWADVPFVECKVCKANSLAARKGREGIGRAVYLRVKPKQKPSEPTA